MTPVAQHRFPRPHPLLVATIGVGGAALALVLGFDALMGRLYERFRPRAERQIGAVMGRPLELGPYRGLGPAGLRIGPTRFLAGPLDGSTLAAEGVAVHVDPLRSLRERTLVLSVRLDDLEADLRPNARSQIWLLGDLPPGDPPRIDLRFPLSRPARVRFWSRQQGKRPFEATLLGRVALQTHRRDLALRADLQLPGSPGWLRIDGSGNWQTRNWQAKVASRGLSLVSFSSLLPIPGALQGTVDGQVALAGTPQAVTCRGRMQVNQLRWLQPKGSTPLQMERLPLQCDGQNLALAATPWRYGPWSGTVGGRTDLERRLVVEAEARPPGQSVVGHRRIDGTLRGRWGTGGLRIEQFSARMGNSRLQASGLVGERLDLRGNWRFDPADLRLDTPIPDWALDAPLLGSLQAGGGLRTPTIRVETGQAGNPLLGTWRASLRWQDQLLRLERLEGDHLLASAQLPTENRPGRGLVFGPLAAQVRLSDFPLARLDPLLGTSLQGRLGLEGQLSGPLDALQPRMNVLVASPRVGPLLLEESWRGELLGLGSGAGGTLQLSALEPGRPGTLRARLDRRWLPVEIALTRGGGTLSLDGDPSRYRWQARDFSLGGLAISAGSAGRMEPIQAWLSGEGVLGLQPLAFEGRVDLADPLFLGVGGRRVTARVDYRDRHYRVDGRIEPLANGLILAQARGTWDGPLWARFEARRLPAVLFRQFVTARSQWFGERAPLLGSGADLGSLAIDTVGGTIADQLGAWQRAQQNAASFDAQAGQENRVERLNRLQAQVDADLTVSGPNLDQLRADLDASAHFWLPTQNRAEILALEPMRLRLQGPISQGSGSFELSGLSLALLALLTPVPDSLRGNLAVAGRYRLGAGLPALNLELALADGELAGEPLVLERGSVALEDRSLAVDLAVRAASASSPVELSGTIPLEADEEKLELRLASRGDGVVFLSSLLGQAVEWQSGSVDLQMLIRGSLNRPIANGFLRVREGQARFVGQDVTNIEATALLDFQQLLLQNFTARVGAQGQIRGEGTLGLIEPLNDEANLTVELDSVPFSVPRVSAVAGGRLTIGGSLRRPRMGGELSVSNGSINAQLSQLAAAEPSSDQPVEPISMGRLLEEKWDFQEPLVLLGQQMESPNGESLRQLVPNAPFLSFQGLRLTLGPNLAVVVPNVAEFTTAGTLLISGKLDPTLRASGVVRLPKGRVTLFTTTFTLDPDSANVAIFTPSLGLVPYVDIAMRTRVSDTLRVGGIEGIGTGGRGSLAELEASGGVSSLNQLNLVLITVSASGPADRLAESLELRSSPPLPQERLLALIGGNTLAGLSGGGAGAALATVLGQTLLSPLLGTLSDAFDRRVSFAIYPTYVSPSLANEEETRSERVPPQLVLGVEIGFDITSRFNASALLIPNRTDIPPQLTLSYKASELFNLQGSFNSEGAWQTQLQYFLRF